MNTIIEKLLQRRFMCRLKSTSFLKKDTNDSTTIWQWLSEYNLDLAILEPFAKIFGSSLKLAKNASQ